MSGVKFELQKEVFESTKERLHGVVTVQKTTRKKKSPAYLCVTGSIERPIRFTIYLVNKYAKEFDLIMITNTNSVIPMLFRNMFIILPIHFDIL